MQHVHAFGVGCHDAVLDAVVDHLDEVTRAGWSAVQVTFLGGAPGHFLAVSSARNVSAVRRERLEVRFKPLAGGDLSANHQTGTTLHPPESTAWPHVQVVDAARGDLFRPSDI